ncbi:MAG: hypothetical protein NDP13_06845 [Crenarchaeota archaeon]|nr:hypothetical protein [Thermoproteota archaeon]
MNSKGVSEVFGGLLVLLAIVGVAGIIFTISYPTIWVAQENVKMRNAYFDLFELREKIERVRSGLEFKSIHTIQLYDLSIDFRNEPIIRINNTNYSISSIKLIGHDGYVAYENGAIIMNRSGIAKMMSSPNINYINNTRTLYLPIIKLQSNFSVAMEGFAGKSVNLPVYFYLRNTSTIMGDGPIVFYSTNANAWEEFFRLIGINFTRSGNYITIQNISYFAVIYEVEIYG